MLNILPLAPTSGSVDPAPLVPSDTDPRTTDGFDTVFQSLLDGPATEKPEVTVPEHAVHLGTAAEEKTGSSETAAEETAGGPDRAPEPEDGAAPEAERTGQTAPVSPDQPPPLPNGPAPLQGLMAPLTDYAPRKTPTDPVPTKGGAVSAPPVAVAHPAPVPPGATRTLPNPTPPADALPENSQEAGAPANRSEKGLIDPPQTAIAHPVSHSLPPAPASIFQGQFATGPLRETPALPPAQGPRPSPTHAPMSDQVVPAVPKAPRQVVQTVETILPGFPAETTPPPTAKAPTGLLRLTETGWPITPAAPARLPETGTPVQPVGAGLPALPPESSMETARLASFLPRQNSLPTDQGSMTWVGTDPRPVRNGANPGAIPSQTTDAMPARTGRISFGPQTDVMQGTVADGRPRTQGAGPTVETSTVPGIRDPQPGPKPPDSLPSPAPLPGIATKAEKPSRSGTEDIAQFAPLRAAQKPAAPVPESNPPAPVHSPPLAPLAALSDQRMPKALMPTDRGDAPKITAGVSSTGHSTPPVTGKAMPPSRARSVQAVSGVNTPKQGFTSELSVSSETPAPEIAEAGLGRAEDTRAGSATGPTMRQDSVFHRPETPVAIARQLTEQALTAQARTVELRLNPEELGRVQMSLASGDDAIVVSIAAERPETLALMRRHIDQLTQEFQRIGYSNVSFFFESQAGSGGDRQRRGGTAPALTAEAPDIPAGPDAAPRRAVPRTGLDIRI